MKKLLNAPHLSRGENFLTLYFIFPPTIFMVWKLWNPLYNPLLFLSDKYGGFLNSSMYDEVTFAMMYGLLFLFASNILTAIVANNYRKKGVTQHTKKLFIAIYGLGCFEFYNRLLVFIFEDHPFSESGLGDVTAGVILRTLIQGGLFIWLTKLVFKRAETIPESGSLEAKLAEIDQLKEKGLINEDEHTTKRSALLS